MRDLLVQVGFLVAAAGGLIAVAALLDVDDDLPLPAEDVFDEDG